MYWFPSISVTAQPSASLMKTGVPPTALNARTGDETPPGISLRALANADSELAIDRCCADLTSSVPGMEARILEAAVLSRNGRLFSCLPYWQWRGCDCRNG